MITVDHVVLYELAMPLKQPFATAHGVYETRRTLLVKLVTGEGLVGYGECEAFAEAWYTEETVETEKAILKQSIIPFLKSQEWTSPSQFAEAIGFIKRHHFAKAGVEMALWDIYSQQQNSPIHRLIGGTREKIDVGVVLGLSDDTKHILSQIAYYEQFGYKRFKIKIKPGHDEAVIAAIREHYPQLPLMVDANSAYTLHDIKQLKRLDHYQLMMIEQPLGETDFLDHAELQQQLQTPICLDESIHSFEDARLAIALSSCRIINVKLGRVGGLTEALRIHQLCQSQNIPLWVGGMIESGVGRMHHIHLASLAQFTIAGDISASQKYWAQDIINPEVKVQEGQIMVPSQTGLGTEINEEQLEHYTIAKLNL